MSTIATHRDPIQAIMTAIRAGDLPRGEELARTYLRRHAGDPAASYLLGLSLVRRGRLGESVEYLRIAAELEPPQRDCLIEYGQVLYDLGRGEEALVYLERATQVDPGSALAWERFAKALLGAGLFGAAIRAGEQAANLDVTRAASMSVVASAWASLGVADEATRWHARAMEAAPGTPDRAASWAYLLNYIDVNEADIAAAHQRYGDLVAAKASRLPALQPRATGGPLRIGFISPDLRDHPVARFIEPFVREHDKDQFSIHLYSSAARHDDVSDGLRRHAAVWRRVCTMSDLDLAERIRADNVDVLIDLAGLTGGTRAAVMAAHLAPVQATYLGYPNTTGISNIDLRIVDSITDPPAAAPFGPERLTRMKGCMLCWTPPELAPEVSPPPSRITGTVTFASFNYLGKLSVRCLRTWARVLQAVPKSRLLIKGKGLAEDASRKIVHAHMQRCGVPIDRVTLAPQCNGFNDHLGAYADADIALDTMPYCGVTTTCEALWMGVPVISSRGTTHAARTGASILTAAGLPELIAEDEDAYVRLAAEIAADPARRADLRTQLRSRIAACPLTDAPGFAARFGSLLIGCAQGA